MSIFARAFLIPGNPQSRFMNLTQQTAKHLRDVFFGKNWTWVTVKDTLENVTWQQATTQVYELNTIAKLTYHIGYYVTAILKVMQGGPLDAHDQYSFDVPEIRSQEDWNAMVQRIMTEAEQLAQLIEQADEAIYDKIFADEKYGNHYRNFHGLIEHTHYHLGQIVVIKKIILQSTPK